MDSIQERIQAAIKPLELRLDHITQKHKQLTEECAVLRELIAGKKDTKNLNMTITSVDRKRVNTVTSPSNRLGAGKTGATIATTARGVKNQLTSPQVTKKSVNSRPVTAFTKPKMEVKPLGPTNTVKAVPIRAAKSPTNQISSIPNKKAPLGKPAVSISSKSAKDQNKPAQSKQQQVLKTFQTSKQENSEPIQILQKTQTKVQNIPQTKQQSQQQSSNLLSQTKKQSDTELPQIFINKTQQTTTPIPSKIIQTQSKEQSNLLETTAQKPTKTLQVQDIKLQNINSAFSVQEKTQNEIPQVQNLACSILKQPDEVFASFIENPTSNNNLTNQCIEEDDDIL